MQNNDFVQAFREIHTATEASCNMQFWRIEQSPQLGNMSFGAFVMCCCKAFKDILALLCVE